MILNAGSGTLWRDMDFDPFSGDVYLRKDNELVKCERTGPNAVTNNQVLDGGALAPLVNNQNVAFVRQATDQVVFWNDRSSGGAGQPFEFAIQCTRSDGIPATMANSAKRGLKPSLSSGTTTSAAIRCSRSIMALMRIVDSHGKATTMTSIGVS